MKIKKTPPKKLAAPIPPIKSLIQKLTECHEEEITATVDSIKEWNYPRGDLFHWIAVLNRFDNILENICQTYKLKKLQTVNFTEGTRSTLLSILKFSRMLLENCTNRNLYGSYEHLNDLLNTSDLGALEVLLRLILRPAQRLSNQRALRTNFNISQDRILTLAHNWATKEYDLEMAQLASDEVKIPEELATLNYQFYRHLTPSEAAETTGDRKGDVAGSVTSTPQKGKRKDSASSTSGTKTGEGVTLISINNIHQYGEADMDILNNIIEEYDIPEEFHYALLNRIRIVTSIKSTESRRKFLIIRILAIAIMAHIVPEHVAQSKLFLYEPDIVANIAELVHPDRNTPIETQTVAFYALDGISRYRSKLGEVLSAVNASANHGILLYVLRRVIADLDNNNPIFNQEYYDAMFALISYFITTQNGGTMVISAGIVPTLLQLLHNKNPQQSKNITKAVGVLDSLVYGFTPSFTSFCNANGVRILVQRIKEEVDYGVQLVDDNQGDFMEDITIAGSSTSANQPATEPVTALETSDVTLPYERSSLLKSMFKFVLHMMQSAGTADGLRNLIDTSLPDSIKKVFEQPKVFGSSIFALAINIIATFIHNEPTSLPIMQEAKLPQTFLKSVMKEIPASVDVIQSIPNAFGAICLNSQGMEIFTQMNPIDKFFTIFTSIEHLRALQDNEVASVLGNNIDELMRHHPSLKQNIMNTIMVTLQRILELGQDNSIVVDDTNILHTGTNDGQSDVQPENREEPVSTDVTMSDADSAKSEEKKENIIVSFIEIAAKFLEGLFQTQSHCREFLKQENGLNIILKFYALPTVPYDFASSSASYSLSHLMRAIAEVDPKKSVTAIIVALNEALQGATNFLNYDGKGGLLVEYIDLDAKDTAKVEEANKTFRSLITLHGYVGLLSDVYCTPVFSHGKSVSSVIEAFVGPDSEVIPSLGKLHRTCVWENVILKSSVPKSWYASQTKPKKPFNLPEISTSSAISAILDDYDKETTDTNEPSVDQNNRQVKNAKYLKFLISHIPSCLTSLFQGLAKMLFTRKAPDASQKASAFKVSDSIAEVLSDHLTWHRYALDSEPDFTNKYNYLTVMLGLLSLLFLDERNQVSLQTMLVISFDKTGGLDYVFTLLRKFWEDAEGIKVLEEYSTIEADDKSKDKLTRIHGCIEVTLNFFQFVASAKLLHDSSQTSTLTSKDREHRFDPYEFLVSLRAKILPIINELWQSSYLTKAPPNIVKSIILNLVQILKAEGEVNQRIEGSSSISSASSIFGRNPLNPLIPDEDRVQQLIDMGFPRSAAETALGRCNNHVQTAAEFLLNHPQTIAAAIFSEAQTAESGRDSSTINQSTGGNAQTDTNASIGSNVDITGTSGDDDDDSSDNDEGNMEQTDDLAQGSQSADRSISSDTPIPMETETTSKKSDKGKGKEVASADQFKALREELKASGANRAIELLDQVEEVIFEVKDLFVLLSKDETEKTTELVVKSIEHAREQPEELRKKALSSRLRLLALLLNETSIQGKIPHLPFNIFSDMLSMVAEQAEQSSESNLPKWLASALLVIEAFISLSDEPKSVESHSKPEESKAIEDPIIDTFSPTDSQRLNLLEYCLSFMKRTDLDKDIIISLLRILVRITRRHSDATEFVKKDGLSLLFNAYKPRAHDFRGQQIFVVMILRHVIEDVSVLESIMEREIKNWFTNHRPRVVDINNYLRNTAQFALRNPEIFVQTTKKLCKLPRYEPGRSSQQITLIKQETEEVRNTTSKDNTVNEEEMTDVVPSTSATVESPKKESFGSELAENLIHYIANELISIRSIQSAVVPESKSAETANEKQKTTENNVNNNNNANNNTTNANNTGSTQPQFKPEEHLDYLSRCFLLQCLTELLSSYPSCKIEVINLSRRKSSIGPTTSSKTRTPLLSYLLNDLLPYGCITPSTDIEIRKRYGQSKWTTSVIVALCSNISNDVDEKKVQPELVQVRKFVLDCIIRSFKNAITSSDPIETKYGRLLALAELCYAILTARTSTSNNANKPIDDGPASVAKLMLDKHFVNTLTEALSEVDLNYPSARILISALLKPFEFLTKIAIKLGRAPEPSKEEQERRESISSISTPSADEMVHETEAPDLYATSVLGALEGRIESDEMEDEDMSSDEEQEVYDNGEYEEETDSDISDLSNEDDLNENDNNNEDMDVEIVVRQPLHSHSTILNNENNDNSENEDNNISHHLEHDDDTDDEHPVRIRQGGDDDQEMWDVHDQVIINRNDIAEEVIDDAEGHHHRHRRHGGFGADDEGMLVDEDDEDDDDDDDDDDDEEADDGEENDVVLDSADVIDDGYVDRLNFNWGWNQPGSIFMNDDDFVLPGRPSRALFSFGNRRHRHIPGGRRAILEVPPEGLDYVISDHAGYGFNFGTNDEVDIPSIRNRPIPGANDDVTSHPLLVNRTSNLPNITGSTGVEFRGRNVRNGPLGDWTQSIEELIGGGAVQLLEQLLTRSRGLGHSTYRLELNTGSGGLVSGIEVDRVFPRSITNAQDNQNITTPPSDPITAVQEFMPVSTGQRWLDEARMMYGNTASEKATKLVEHILNALIPLAVEEDKKRKEKEEKEREERKIRDEEERKKAEEEERVRRELEERARAEAEAARAAETQNITSDTSMAENTTEPEEVVEVTETTEIIELGDAMQEDAPVTETEENIENPDAMDAEPSPAQEIVPTISEDSVAMEEEPTVTEGGATTSQASQAVVESTIEGAAEGTSETQSARTTVIVNGQPVDITDTGIDPTFLEALPDELREEVLNQHLPPERRNRPPVSGAGDTISTEFLEALPVDLREEILQQEAALEQERRDRQRTTEPVAAEMDTASFFASLDPQLRQTVLLEQDEMVLASLPPAIVAEANALRERASRRYTNAVRSRTIASTNPAVQTPKKPTVQRDAMKLVDTPGLATLVRLLFLPQPLGNKNLLHKLLLNLCENSKTRGELILMLLSVLYDGSGDVAAVDKSFAQMSLRAKGTPKSTPRRQSSAPNPSLAQITQAAGENVPNLIAQRCLEALTYIVTYNEASVTYFLMEHESNIGLKRSNSRKGKEKQTKSSVSKYPVVILLSLLDRQVFIKNTALMDQLMHLLSFVLRPLSTLSKSESSTSSGDSGLTSNNGNEGGSSSQVNNNNVNNNENNNTNSSENNNTSITENNTNNNENDSHQISGTDSQNNNPNNLSGQSNQQPNNEQPSNQVLNISNDQNNNNNLETNNNNNASGNETNQDNATASSSKQAEPEKLPTLKPPVIPENCLRLVVNVLTAGECTSNTFKYTLSVIQHLSTLSGAREVITSELVERAQSLGNDILEDLDDLAQILDKANTGVDVQGVTLSKFSPSSSKQAKLLRVLKTIDYMYSRKQQSNITSSNTQTEVSLAPTVDPDEAETVAPRTLLDSNARNSKLTDDEEKVMKIYETLNFTELWKKLGRCLTTIHEKPDMIHVATVLLPLIESLMVVCKYVGMTSSSQKLSSPGPHSSPSESMEDLFFTFTEDHRKILNTMVRNNPSLMSGSFSLLVHNPKILEFDNKRNYFNQQLHKRTNAREHYGSLQLNVRRAYVFEDSFQNLQRRTGDEIKYGKLSVRFYEEEGVDAGGVTREWFQVLARQMFNEDYALFKTSAADRLTYQPNRASGANPEHLLFFKFVGRVIGKAIYDGRLLDAYFTRSFYKHILGKPVDYRDVEAIDLEYYNSLVWMLNNDITGVIDYTFSVETDDFGQKKIIDLKENGRNIPVTEENKREYVKLVTEQKLTLAIKDQIEHFLAGFHEIIPAHLISIFNEQELELLISGMPDIDIDDWKNNTEYQNYTPSSPQIQWFWRAVRSFDQEERAKLLQFVTGTSKVPLEGFSVLQGVHGVQKFQIHKDFASADRLPSAHTCFNQIDIPEYENYEQLRSQLLLAISEGTTGFGFQ